MWTIDLPAGAESRVPKRMVPPSRKKSLFALLLSGTAILFVLMAACMWYGDLQGSSASVSAHRESSAAKFVGTASRTLRTGSKHPGATKRSASIKSSSSVVSQIEVDERKGSFFAMAKRRRIFLGAAITVVVLMAITGILLWQLVFVIHPSASVESGGESGGGGNITPQNHEPFMHRLGFFDANPWMIGVIVVASMLLICAGVFVLFKYVKHVDSQLSCRPGKAVVESGDIYKKSKRIQIQFEDDQQHKILMSVGDDGFAREPLVKLNLLGSGGSGEVYLARNMATRTNYAAKFLDEPIVNRVELEFLMRMRGNPHPNIIGYYGKAQIDGKTAYMYEFLGYGSLEVLREQLLLNSEATEAILACISNDVLSGLKCICDNGIVHKDIKPDNLGMSLNGDIKILDFGIAEKVVGKHKPEATLQYAPPEVLSIVSNVKVAVYIGPIDGRADIYSLGMSLLRLVCNPFKALGIHNYSSLETIEYILTNIRDNGSWVDHFPFEVVSGLGAGGSEISQNLRLFLEGCLKIHPQHRFTADDALKHEFISSHHGNLPEARIALAQLLERRRLGGSGHGLL